MLMTFGQGLRLELRAPDKPGLLADVTRTFRENGLSVTRADVTTTDDSTAENVFYVTDAAGNAAEEKAIEAVRQRIGLGCLEVKEPAQAKCPASAGSPEAAGGVGFFSLGSIVMRNLYNLGLIRSCS